MGRMWNSMYLVKKKNTKNSISMALFSEFNKKGISYTTLFKFMILKLIALLFPIKENSRNMMLKIHLQNEVNNNVTYREATNILAPRISVQMSSTWLKVLLSSILRGSCAICKMHYENACL